MSVYVSRYELMRFSAKYILDAAEDEYKQNKQNSILSEKEFTFEMADISQKRRILMETAMHTDNAMLFQIRECLKRMPGYKAPQSRKEAGEMLLRSIIYVDFTDVFDTERRLEAQIKKNEEQDLTAFQKVLDEAKPKEDHEVTQEGTSPLSEDGRDGQTHKIKEDFLRFLFVHGFSLLYEDEELVTYVPFDKSANMSRASQMTFVDKKLIDATDDLCNIEKRATLDIDFTAIEVIPSKYYAYRGLYFTDSKRIPEKGQFALNEETVIVLKDDVQGSGYVHHTLEHKNIITYDKAYFTAEETRGQVKAVTKTDAKIENVQAFDGEGIISPLFADQINAGLSAGKRVRAGVKKEKATSFQIRMPFAKGMLHQVDFHAFMKEFTQKDDLMIEDAFGKMRDLSKAQIVLTTSMFKCWGWLTAYAKDLHIDDPMYFYFEKFHKYDHALYVGNTNLNNPLRDTVKLNYQFINTLAMDEETVSELVAEQVSFSDEILTDPRHKGRKSLLRVPDGDGTDADGAVIEETDPEQDNTMQAWKYALQENEAFVYDPYIRDLLRSESLSLLENIAEGKLEVSGALEYLSDDLFALLIYMIRITDLDEKLKDELADKLKKHTLFTSRFYMADAQDMGLEYGKYYTILRSPHLSRNEQCALRPYMPNKNEKDLICHSDDGEPMNVYHKYFSHLKGVLMVAFNSDAALTLGGADFDGDYVKIITDKRITDAVLRGTYEKTEKGFYERKLPIPVISSPKGKAVHLRSPLVPDPADRAKVYDRDQYYEDICELAKNTFDNYIGLISNRTIELGRQEYFGSPEIREEYSGKCALSTVIAGLEIDAVKTGIHPEHMKGKRENDPDDVRYDFIYRIKKLVRPTDPKKLKIEESDDGLTVSGFSNGSKALKISPDEYKDAVHSNIDYLPYRYFEALYNRKYLEDVLTEEARDDDTPRFLFEHKSFQNESYDEKKIHELADLIATFRRFNQRTGNFIRSKKSADSSQAIRYVHSILRRRYDYSLDVLPGSGTDLRSAAELAYSNLRRICTNKEQAEEARQIYNMQKHSYAIAPEEKWPEIIREILDPDDLEPAAAELFLEPTRDGYKILYYMLSALCEEYKTTNAVDIDKEMFYLDMAEQKKKPSKTGGYVPVIDKKLYEEMMTVYRNADLNKVQRLIWTDEIRKMCLERMKQIFNGDMNDALRYAHSLRNDHDRSGSFFWTMFNVDTVAANLYYAD